MFGAGDGFSRVKPTHDAARLARRTSASPRRALREKARDGFSRIKPPHDAAPPGMATLGVAIAGPSENRQDADVSRISRMPRPG
jgi:hypothetical protein